MPWISDIIFNFYELLYIKNDITEIQWIFRQFFFRPVICLSLHLKLDPLFPVIQETKSTSSNRNRPTASEWASKNFGSELIKLIVPWMPFLRSVDWSEEIDCQSERLSVCFYMGSGWGAAPSRLRASWLPFRGTGFIARARPGQAGPRYGPDRGSDAGQVTQSAAPIWLNRPYQGTARRCHQTELRDTPTNWRCQDDILLRHVILVGNNKYTNRRSVQHTTLSSSISNI